MTSSEATSGISFLNWNARGLKNKMNELEQLVSERNTDIAVITETFLKPDTLVKLSGFSCHRHDRLASLGGGVAIFVKENIGHCALPTPTNTNIESTAIQITVDHKKIIIIAVYCPPHLALNRPELDQLLGLGDRILIVGDLNARHKNWNCHSINKHGRTLQNLSIDKAVEINFPNQYTYYPPNNKRASTIDLTLSKNISTLSQPTALNALSSDHIPVEFTILGSNNRSTKYRYAYEKVDWDNFRSHLHQKTLLTSSVPNSPHEIDELINITLTDIAEARDKLIPTVEISPWKLKLPRELKAKIKNRNDIRKIWFETRDKYLKSLVNKLSDEIKIEINELRNKNLNRKFQNLKTNDNSLWNTIRSIRKKKSQLPALNNGTTNIDNDLEKANLLAETFLKNYEISKHLSDPRTITTVKNSIEKISVEMPGNTIKLTNIKLITPTEISNHIKFLRNKKAPGFDKIENIMIKNLPFKIIIQFTKIFNSCLRLGYFPTAWKYAKVIPIHKPNKINSLPNSYRPISLLSVISKIFEKLILSRLGEFSKDIINPEQFGFRNGHSTVHQLTRLVENISEGFNRKRNTGLVCLDLEKAFDTVWIDGLIHKMILLEFPAYLIKITQSYLNDRTFSVVVNDTMSTPQKITAGVPQGSVLGPHLFSIFLHDIPKTRNTSLALYADDTAYFSSSRNNKCIIKNLQLSLDKVRDFFNKWKLKVNSDKTEAVLFTVKRKTKNIKTYPLFMDTTGVTWKTELKYLGVTLDRKLNWNNHLKNIKNRGLAVMSALSPIFRRRSAISRKNKLIIYKSLIRPVLTYAAPMWSNMSKTSFTKLQTVQNKALKIIFNTMPRTNLKKLHIKYKIKSIREVFSDLTLKFYNKISKHHNTLIKSLGDYNRDSHKFKYIHKMPKHIIL